MEFFRKYQRPILFTAGIFALVTFSITGALYEVVGNFFTDRPPLPTVVVAGRTVELQPEDNDVGLRLRARGVTGDSGFGLLPNVGGPESDDTEVRDVLAALRRIAIELGIEASRTEVDKAIDHKLALLAEQAQAQGGEAPTIEQLASIYGGERAMRDTLFEALRIGTLIRLQALGIDSTDRGIAERLAKLIDLVSYRGVLVDSNEISDQIEADFDAKSTEDQDAALREYLDGLDYNSTFGFREANKHKAQFLAMSLEGLDEAGRDAFASSFREQAGLEADQAWKDSVSDDEIDTFLTTNRYYLYPPKDDAKKGDDQKEDGEKEEGEGENGDQDPKDGEEESNEPDREEVRFRVFAERVVTNLLDQVRERLDAHVDASRAEIDALLTAESKARLVLDDKNLELAKLQDEEEVDEEAVDALVEEIRGFDDAVREAQKAVLAKQLEILRAFDGAAAWTELSGGDSRFQVLENEEFLTQVELRQYEPVGEWNFASSIESLSGSVPMASRTFQSKTMVFGARLLDRIERPLKDLEDIRDALKTTWLGEQSTERFDELVEAFEKEIDERARALLGDSVTEIEDAQDTRVQERFDEWKTNLEAELTADQEKLAKTRIETDLRKLRRRIAGFEEQLEKAEDKRDEFTTEVEAEIEEEVGELIAGKVREVFADSAAAAGLEMRTTGLLPKDLSRQGRPRDTWDPFIGAIFYSTVVNDISKVEEVTDGFVDAAGAQTKVWAELVEKKDGTIADVTPRRLAQARPTMTFRRGEAAVLSFTIDALRDRWGYEDRRTDPPKNAPSN